MTHKVNLKGLLNHRSCCCELCNVMTMVIISLFLCNVSRASMDTLFRGTYRTPQWILYFEGCIVCHDGYYYRGSCHTPWQIHGQICPPWVPDWKQRVCITRSDMHHYNCNCIPLHCTYLSLVRLILCFADFVNAFLWNWWLMKTKLVVEYKYNLLNYCC